MATQKNSRSSWWGFILYEDSAPKNYLDVLKAQQVAFALSPWHDKDVWNELDEKENPQHIAGSPKKKHRHGVFKFDSLKNLEQVKLITDLVNSPRPQKLHSPAMSIQYFTHKNDLEKAQYDVKDILDCGVGVDDFYLAVLTRSQKKKIVTEMVLFMRQNKIDRLSTLIEYAQDNKPEWFDLFQDHYLKTFEWLANGYYQEKNSKKSFQKVQIPLDSLVTEVEL